MPAPAPLLLCQRSPGGAARCGNGDHHPQRDPDGDHRAGGVHPGPGRGGEPPGPVSPRYVRQPFSKELDFGVTSGNYDLNELLGLSAEPGHLEDSKDC